MVGVTDRDGHPKTDPDIISNMQYYYGDKFILEHTEANGAVTRHFILTYIHDSNFTPIGGYIRTSPIQYMEETDGHLKVVTRNSVYYMDKITAPTSRQ